MDFCFETEPREARILEQDGVYHVDVRNEDDYWTIESWDLSSYEEAVEEVNYYGWTLVE